MTEEQLQEMEKAANHQPEPWRPEARDLSQLRHYVKQLVAEVRTLREIQSKQEQTNGQSKLEAGHAEPKSRGQDQGNGGGAGEIQVGIHHDGQGQTKGSRRKGRVVGSDAGDSVLPGQTNGKQVEPV